MYQLKLELLNQITGGNDNENSVSFHYKTKDEFRSFVKKSLFCQEADEKLPETDVEIMNSLC